MPSTQEVTKEKMDQLGNVFEQFKKSNDERLKALETKGAVDPTIVSKVDKANEDLGRLDNEIKELKTALNRRPSFPENDERQEKLDKTFGRYKGVGSFLFQDGKFDVDKDKEYQKASVDYIKRGTIDQKSLSVGFDPDGGYLVRPEVGDLIQTTVHETSPFRRYMGQVTISTDALEAPTHGDLMGATRVGEKTARTNTDTPTFGQIRIETPELYAQPKATQKFLDDAALDVESWLAMKAAERFALRENNEFALGTGPNEARGFLTYAAGTGAGQIEQVNSGHASQLKADGLIDLEAALKTAYKNGAVWFSTRKTLSLIRKLKDGNGNYLWQPGLREGNASTLVGHPYEEAADMPEVEADALAIAFGNFRIGYMIVDRLGIRFLRDPYTDKPFVVFDFTKRIGGAVVVHEAIKIQKIAA